MKNSECGATTRLFRRDTKGKGCDIGYALATNSCEGVDDVEACTVTAFDAITAFAVSYPNGLLAEPSVFSGPSVPMDCSIERITQPTSDQQRLLKLTLSAVDENHPNLGFVKVNAEYLCNGRFFSRTFAPAKESKISTFVSNARAMPRYPQRFPQKGNGRKRKGIPARTKRSS